MSENYKVIGKSTNCDIWLEWNATLLKDKSLYSYLFLYILFFGILETASLTIFMKFAQWWIWETKKCSCLVVSPGKTSVFIVISINCLTDGFMFGTSLERLSTAINTSLGTAFFYYFSISCWYWHVKHIKYWTVFFIAVKIIHKERQHTFFITVSRTALTWMEYQINTNSVIR